jgi:hypothetical protein
MPMPGEQIEQARRIEGRDRAGEEIRWTLSSERDRENQIVKADLRAMTVSATEAIVETTAWWDKIHY